MGGFIVELSLQINPTCVRVHGKHSGVGAGLQRVQQLGGFALWAKRIGLYLQYLRGQQKTLTHFYLIDQISKNQGRARFLFLHNDCQHEEGSSGRNAEVLGHDSYLVRLGHVAVQAAIEVHHPQPGVNGIDAGVLAGKGVADESVPTAVLVFRTRTVQGCARLCDPRYLYLVGGFRKHWVVVVDVDYSYVDLCAAAGWRAAELRLDGEHKHGLRLVIQRLLGSNGAQPRVNGELSVLIARGDSVKHRLGGI